MKDVMFEGCSFVFIEPGACPVESPFSLRYDNFAGVDLLDYMFTMKATFLSDSNVVPFNPGWRREWRQAR